jgi:cell division protein ZipA
MTRSTIFILAVLIGLACLLVWLRHRSLPGTKADAASFEIVPESVSRDRAARVLPTKGSEEASHLLPPIPLHSPPPQEQPDDYPPDPGTDWVIEIHLPPGLTLSGKAVQAVFSQPWLREHGGAVIHGYVPQTRTWTYVGAGDAPEPYSKLALAKSLAHTDHLSAAELAAMLASATNRAAAWPGATVSSTEPPSAAAARATRLLTLQREYDLAVTITLRAPAGSRFEGRQVWDAMLSLGLQWGDMDLFHWHNDTGAGDDSWFMVATSTAPGYFLPEQIAAGTVQVDDLQFSFSIPRSASPAVALDRMFAAATYAHSRLGGRIVDSSQSPFDLAAAHRDLSRIEEALTNAGFPPGADQTLRLF